VAGAEDHIQELLKLSVEDRAHAARLLLDSLDGDLDANAGDMWAIEIERRLARIEAGEAKMISANDAIERIRRAARGQ